MKFISFNGVSFASLNVTASLPNDTPDTDRSAQVVNRLNKTGFVAGMQLGARTIPVYFQVKPTFDIEQTILALIAALDPDNADARTLIAQLNDGTTNVQVQARPGQYIARPGDTKGLLVPFITDDPRWKATTDTTAGPYSFAATGTQAFTVNGQGRVIPLIKVGWSVQRASSSTTNGWKYRKRITVTNNSDQSLHNHVIQLGPFNTATLIAASKMRTDCADLTVFNERGERLRVSLYGANSRGTFFSFVVDELVAGGSRTYDVAYGNPSAFRDATLYGFPMTFSGSPAPDVTGIDGQATAGTVSSLSTGVTMDPNRFVGGTILLTGATTNIGGQYRRVSSHTTGGVTTVSRNFSTTPDTTTGYVILSGPFMGDGGVASAKTATSLTDSSQSWFDNEWIGATVEVISLSTTMGTVLDYATVTGNTATALTFSAWNSGSTPVANVYRVYKRNGNLIYRVEQNSRSGTIHRGRWRLNKGQTKPSGVFFAADGAPHAWTPTIYNPANAQNDFNQPRVTGADVGGGDIDYFSILNATIARKNGKKLEAEGWANGVELSVPLGILGTRHDYKFKNPSPGMARAVYGCRERGGEDWELYKENASVYATTTAQATAYYDLTAYGTPVHLIAAITSDDDADIEKEQTGFATLSDNTILEVRVDTRLLSVTDVETATEDSVYDMTLRIRRSTNASITAGDDEIRIGGSEKHLFLASGEKLWIGAIGDVPLACRIYNGTTWIRDAPWPVEIFHIDNDYLGVATRYVSSDVLPLNPGSQTLRVNDPDGTMGTVTVEAVYRSQYL